VDVRTELQRLRDLAALVKRFKDGEIDWTYLYEQLRSIDLTPAPVSFDSFSTLGDK
jgi:hypothetical protein